MANIENLRRAVEHLKTIDESMFDMTFFVGVKTEMCINLLTRISELDIKQAECGTVGCVVGHCAVLDKPHFDNILKLKGSVFTEDYSFWSSKFFDLCDDDWDWLFGADWAKYNNTIAGAIYRIENFIINEDAPEEYYNSIDLVNFFDNNEEKYQQFLSK